LQYSVLMRSIRRPFALVSLVLVAGILLAYKPTDKYFEIAKNLDIFATLFKEVNKFYVEEVDPEELVETGINSMLSALDPYTNYIPEEKLEDYRTLTTGEYGGIGALIGKHQDKIVVLMPNEGFAAHKAGVQIGDEILEIDGKNVQGLEVEDVSNLLKGKEQTKVTLLIKKLGFSQPRKVTLTREKILLENVPYHGMINSEIGMIQLTDFTKSASKEVKQAVSNLKAQGAKKLVLDLRGNPGGLLHEAINIANVFLPKGSVIVETRGKVEEWNRKHKALNQPLDIDMPMAVLIDEGSASAAEIVAGVIQDYDRGVLIGKRSFGKGLVQQTMSLAYNSKLKITVAKYYIPSGRCIQKIDYSKRNEYGMVNSIPDSLRVAYKTSGGRTVLDGGGIDPDIIPRTHSLAPITRSLISKGLIFDYANAYFNKHPSIPQPKAFTLPNAEYEMFKAWLKDKDYDYETKVERMLDDLITTAKKEKYYQDIQKQIDALGRRITHNKERDLEKFREEIIEVLEAEIAKRYYLHKGYVESSFDDDPDINKAVEVLQSADQYQKILTAKK